MNDDITARDFRNAVGKHNDPAKSVYDIAKSMTDEITCLRAEMQRLQEDFTEQLARAYKEELMRIDAEAEVQRLTGVLAYMRDDKSLKKPGYFRRVAALALQGETNTAWTSTAHKADTPKPEKTPMGYGGGGDY